MQSNDGKKKPADTATDGQPGYQKPTLTDHGDARDLTRSNPGSGGDGAPFDGGDTGLDGGGTAS